MVTKSKQEVRKGLPPLCAAVRKLRQTSGDSLEAFSRWVGISLNSASRFELGKAEPKDIGVLWKLEAAARTLSLPEEEKLFATASRAESVARWNPLPVIDPGPMTKSHSYGMSAHSLGQWRLMQAAEMIWSFFPECVEAVEEALAPALEIIDDVLVNAERLSYQELVREANARGNTRQLANLMQRRRK
jgi:hypothetical protein